MTIDPPRRTTGTCHTHFCANKYLLGFSKLKTAQLLSAKVYSTDGNIVPTALGVFWLLASHSNVPRLVYPPAFLTSLLLLPRQVLLHAPGCGASLSRMGCRIPVNSGLHSRVALWSLWTSHGLTGHFMARI